MKIDNIRFGHACNSSSSHSFLIPSGTVSTDEYSHFGWGNFTVAPSDIDYYIAAAVMSHVPYGDQLAQAKAVNWIMQNLEVGEVDEDAYVDHQSLMDIPCRHGSGEFNWDYVLALRNYLKSHGVGVSGGNDNDDSSFEAFDGKHFAFVAPIECGYSTAKYSGNQWILYRKETGDKVRFRLDDKPPRRPDSPELVDIKITDFCNSNCGYCYQGSTKDGKHAETSDVLELLAQLAKLEVFEVAIGGGEATDHPDFKLICENAKSLGITPNLTTRNYNFVRDNYTWCAEALGAIAVSVDNSTSVERVAALNTLACGQIRFIVQVVCGGVWDLDKIIEKAAESRLGLTLLGFKEQERGKGYPRRDYNNWIDSVTNHYRHGFNVDTAFLQLHETELRTIAGKKFDQLAVLFEGMYSCYIDSVAMEIAPSSFCDKSLYRSLASMSVKQAWDSMEPVR